MRRRYDSPSPQSQDGPSSRAEQSGQLHQGTQQQSRGRTIPNQTYVIAESSRRVCRINPHAVLPSSVTSYSDVGQHPSDRSTYGVPKPGRKKKPPPVPARVSYTGQLSRSGPTVRRVNEMESEVESLREVAHRGVGNNLPLRTRAGARARSKAAPSQDVEEHEDDVDSRSSAEETVYEDEPPTATVHVFRANAVTMRLIDEINHAWNINKIERVFPQRIWPKRGTEWSKPVLEIFLSLAKKYPEEKYRRMIGAYFVQLCLKRRENPNAKAQWKIVDAKNTEAWANEHCRPSSVPGRSSKGQRTALDMSSSQQQRRSSPTRTVNKGKQKASQGKEAIVQRKTRRPVYDLPDSSESE
jgi:hypothetical protein